MSTSKTMIREWLEEAKKAGATHMLVVCDTFDYEDYPSNVMPHESVEAKIKYYNGASMQSIMEVYSLTGKHSIESQLGEGRAYHTD